MAMEQTGFVSEVLGDSIKVRVDRESACGGNCAGCHGCPQNAVLITCPNDTEVPFLLGEKVKVVMATGTFFFGMLGSYGVLILALFLGAILGFFLTHSEGISALGALVGLLLGGGWVSFYSKKFRPKVIAKRMDR